ncbi:hypothetical protein DFJ68_0441 [Terracoccus luteus]|uniref:DUF222 domain-containing protein n=1 Tax=Terracoccus luteus TaxID=53356 RepID=A0A495XRA1_9MICO|nr:hypothetical protein DFJ68_0441 [Terracoccus luteus]
MATLTAATTGTGRKTCAGTADRDLDVCAPSSGGDRGGGADRPGTAGHGPPGEGRAASRAAVGPSESPPRDRAARPPVVGDAEAFESELAGAVDELLRRCCAEAQSRRLADDVADDLAWAPAGEQAVGQAGVTHGEPAPDVVTDTAEAAMAASLAEFEAAERLCAVVAHAQLGALRRMHGCAQALEAASSAQSWAGRTPLEAVELVTLEVTAATGLNTSDVDTRLQLAEAPEGRLGAVRRALALGRTTLRRAVRLTQLTRHLDDEAADRVARAVLAPTRDGAGLSDRLFAQRLRRALLVVDPDRVASRRAARRRIGAWARIDDDGTGTLTVVNDAEAVVAAVERADAAARAARAAGDPRTLDQLRADFITGAAMFGWPGDDPWFAGRPARPAGTVSVVVPFSTLVGLDDEPCELPGHGWVGASTPARSPPPTGPCGRYSSPTSTPAVRWRSRRVVTGRPRRWCASCVPSTAPVEGRGARCPPTGATSTTTCPGRSARHTSGTSPASTGPTTACAPPACGARCGTLTAASSGGRRPDVCTSPARTTGSRATVGRAPTWSTTGARCPRALPTTCRSSSGATVELPLHGARGCEPRDADARRSPLSVQGRGRPAEGCRGQRRRTTVVNSREHGEGRSAREGGSAW